MKQQVSPEVQISRIGHENIPIAVIDNFSGKVKELVNYGERCRYFNGGAFYPGIRSPIDPRIFSHRQSLIMEILTKVFGFRGVIKEPLAALSMVTKDESDLVPVQRLPHYDHYEGKVVAGMLYLLGEKAGGTAFYRHCRTGFEKISRERETTYKQALEKDTQEFGEPPEGYYYGSTKRFELIGEAISVPDRLVLYPGRLLHSGVIRDPKILSPDPSKGRLTVNMFFLSG